MQIGSGLCRAWGSLWDECRMPQDCCHFSGPQQTPCLTVSDPDSASCSKRGFLSLWAPLFQMETGRSFSAFSIWHPKTEHIHVSFRVHFSKDFSLPITGYAESSSQPGPCASTVLCLWCCPASRLQPPPRHSSSSQLSPEDTYLPALPVKLPLTVTTPNQVPVIILITCLYDVKKNQ